MSSNYARYHKILTQTFGENLYEEPRNVGSKQGDCRKEPRRDPLCTKTKINQNS